MLLNVQEVRDVAGRAWAAMTHRPDFFDRQLGLDPGPMPAAIALDMVQDVTGDRIAARVALHHAAADWLGARVPSDPDRTAANVMTCAAVLAHLQGSHLALTRARIEELAERSKDQRLGAVLRGRSQGPEAEIIRCWSHWVEIAREALGLCYELELLEAPQ